MACSRRSRRCGSKPKLSAAFSSRVRSSGVITPSARASAKSSSYWDSSGPSPNPPDTSPATKPAPCSKPPSLISATSVRMLTFLPFSRAVKACPRSIAVCALMLCASCVSRGAAPTLTGPPTGPLRAPAAVPTPPLAAVSTADAVRADPSSADAAPEAPAVSAPEVVLEQPYPIDARPRSSIPMQAAAEDEELARWNIGGSADPSYPSSQASYHPGTRVVVDTRLAKRRSGALASLPPARGLTPERVQAQARSHGYWPFRLCFETGQREKKGSGGETRVAFT